VGRRWIVAGLVVVVAVALGVGLALASNGDSPNGKPADSASRAATTRSTQPSTTTVPMPLPVPAEAPATTATTTPAPARGTAPDACGAEQPAITTAIRASASASPAAPVVQCRFAASDRRWVAVMLDDRAAPGATVLLLQDNGAWRVIASGTRNVGCGLAPQTVLVDLGLLCIGSGGGQ
jgi:hypothetical protein